MAETGLSAEMLTKLKAACSDDATFERIIAVVAPLLEGAERRNAELQRSQAVLQALVDNFPGGIVSVMDVQMRHLYVGGETVISLGFTVEDMIGKTPSEYKSGEKADNLEANIRRAMRGEPVRILENDGVLSTLVTCTPVYGDAGELVGTIVVGQDVSDLVLLQDEKFAEERVRSRLEREIATSQARAVIIEQVLHEVRNPLASLSSSAEMLEHYDDRMNHDKRNDHLRRIYFEVRTLAATLAQLAQIND